MRPPALGANVSVTTAICRGVLNCRILCSVSATVPQQSPNSRDNNSRRKLRAIDRDDVLSFERTVPVEDSVNIPAVHAVPDDRLEAALRMTCEYTRGVSPSSLQEILEWLVERRETARWAFIAKARRRREFLPRRNSASMRLRGEDMVDRARVKR
jgi:hypothetical protein